MSISPSPFLRAALMDSAVSSRGTMVQGPLPERRQSMLPGREADSLAPCSGGPSTSSSGACCVHAWTAAGSSWHRSRSQCSVQVPRCGRFHLTTPLRFSSLGSLQCGSGFPQLNMSQSDAWGSQRTQVEGNGVVQAMGLKDDNRERASPTSSASVFSPNSPHKFNRLDSTLPLSATASSFKASVKVLYSLATHGGLIAFGCLICKLSGRNVMDAFHLDDPMVLAEGLLLALPPILLASFLHLEPVVQAWEVARGVRDAEEEELLEYYVGMAPTQFIPVAIASAVSQEVFFRAALQGSLAMMLYLGGTAGLEGNLMSDLGAPCSIGMAAVSGYFPAFAPFSQLHAAVVMAAITGSFDYATSLRSVPNVIITDGRDLRALRITFGEWYQRQQLKSIYAPMFTATLALYFGLEWVLFGNLLAPVISHSLYLTWSMASGLARLDRQRNEH